MRLASACVAVFVATVLLSPVLASEPHIFNGILWDDSLSVASAKMRASGWTQFTKVTEPGIASRSLYFKNRMLGWPAEVSIYTMADDDLRLSYIVVHWDNCVDSLLLELVQTLVAKYGKPKSVSTFGICSAYVDWPADTSGARIEIAAENSFIYAHYFSGRWLDHCVERDKPHNRGRSQF